MYSGQTKIQTPLHRRRVQQQQSDAAQALRMAYDEIKKGWDTNLHHEELPSASDHHYLETCWSSEPVKKHFTDKMDALLKRLHGASSDGDYAKVKQLTEEDPLLLDKVLTEARNNPLHIAALKGHADFTREVLRLKPELASQLNGEGRAPLHLAAARGHHQVAAILIHNKVGSDICHIRETNHGYIPVHIATVNRNHDVVIMLVERCKDTLDETTYKQETLLHLAVKANCFNLICYLINQNAKLNEKDVNGNTCLHLAAAKPNRQVIEHLLNQENIEINPRNDAGQTPLDVLLASRLHSDVDVSDLAITLQSAGGMRARELSELESNTGSSAVVETARPPGNRKLSRGNINRTREKLSSDAQTLLIVATLVATITFQAITNPPGGFIQPPIDKNDTLILHPETLNSTSWIDRWESNNQFPSGRPVLLYQLSTFFILDSSALFSSVSVILWLLIAEPKTKIVMKFLVAVVWFAVFCTAGAFGSAFLAIYDQVNFNWVVNLLFAFFGVYVFAGLWTTVLMVSFLWRMAGFKRELPNWIAQVLWLNNCMWFRRIIDIFHWLKGSTPFKKIVCSVLMVSAVAAFVLSAGRVFILIIYATRAKYESKI